MVLLDSLNKRIPFLKEVIQNLGLQTIKREINTRCKKLEEENDSLKEEIAKLK